MIENSDIKRILILGHTGFIGSRLERHFYSLSPQLQIVGRSLPAIDLTKEKDTDSLSEFCGLDTAVIMCAAIKRQFGDSVDTFMQNLKMAMNLCRLLEKCPVRRLIFFSSTAVYGEDINNTDIMEETLVFPTSYYGIAKYTCERLFCKTIKQQKQSSLFILRPPLIYGPGDLGATYGPAGFIKAALNKETIVLWGDGLEQREFIFVEDIAKIVYRLAFCKDKGVVNVASGKSHTFKDVTEIISRVIANEIKVSSRLRTKDKADNKFCNKRFAGLFKDFVFTHLQEGIRETIAAQKCETIPAGNDTKG